MEEKILMRIHDDENDCDLVSVKNPLGHFGMSIFAEKNGARKPVDGMHMLSKMIEQVGNGGWPADLPKPSVGGYGYTEQGEQVLFDGDLLIDQPSQPPTGAVYNIIDIDQLEVGETYKIVWNGVDYTCECMSVDLGGGDELAYLGNLSIMGFPISTDYPFLFVYQEDGYMVATLTTGTYSIKLSKSGETIHKIDEKYLPQSGGIEMLYLLPIDDNWIIAKDEYSTTPMTANELYDMGLRGAILCAGGHCIQLSENEAFYQFVDSWASENLNKTVIKIDYPEDMDDIPIVTVTSYYAELSWVLDE